MTRRQRIGPAGILSALLLAGPAAAEGVEEAGAFFETKVRPVLVTHCGKCHSSEAKALKGGLRVDNLEALLKGGDTGPALVPGKPDESLLVEAVGYASPDLRMPPKGKLPDAAIADLKTWVEMGAPWPKDAAHEKTAGADPRHFDLKARRATHWAWRPIRPQEPPEVKDVFWPRGAIDRFVLARLEAAGLSPARPADKRTLIRRVTFDLTGLPPSPREVEAFVRDESPGAFETVVDRLLASPHFGERWARHWLDLVRYAETRGHEFEPLIPNAWQYRDYVIRALNADVPYDQFVVEHLAGDLIETPRRHPAEGFNESILGTAFWFLGEEVHSPVDTRKDETDRIDNRLDVMTKTFLGLTVGCARCHDHKFDAISQADYSAMTGFLLSSTYRQVCFETLEHNRAVAEALDHLQHDEGGSVLKLVAEASTSTVQRLADYLLAAREVIVPSAERPGSRLVAVARARSLDAETLHAWVREAIAARTRPDHPLYPFAVLAFEPAGDDPARFAEHLKAVLGRFAQDPSTAKDLGPEQVVIDYTQAPGSQTPATTVGADRWYSDGFTFGLGPTRPGDVVLGDDPRRPIAVVVSLGSARRDPAWNGLGIAPGTERDHARLGGWDRPGRTLRTPEVTLASGSLYYLVRGSGRAYASVDSHLVIAGPLHGGLLKEWKAEEGAWTWVRHDLTSYKGHRAHVEFTPATATGAMAIARVVESDQRPAPPASPSARIHQALGEASITDLAGMAEVYRDVMEEVAQAMASGRLADAPGLAALADWLARRGDLFLAPAGDTRERLAGDVGPLLRKRAELIGRIRSGSQTAPAMFEGNGVDERLLIRGSHKTPGATVPRRSLEALGGAVPEGYGPGSGRLRLARQLLADDDPFPARVLVNRVWHHLLGRGIVPTVDNFGVLGEPPSHPELLDWLAGRFRAELGWSLKRLIREVVLSSTYRMSSESDPRAAQDDPRNVLRHHMPVRRLEAEAIRDAILTASGRLDPRVLGPPVEVHLTPFLEGRGRPESSGPLDGDGRRSLYTKVRRNFLPPMMLAFDMPAPFSTVGRRTVSNVPAQALILMNDPFVVAQAKLWGHRVASGPGSPEDRVAAMYLTAFARPPRASERAEALAFLDRQGALLGIPAERRREDPDVWADLAHVLFNVKEFVFLR